MADGLEERFWAKVDKNGDCWNWTACLDAYGYGRIGIGRSGTQIAHRIAYELVVGPIPEGLSLDHLCRNRACVNPAHLEPVSRGENVRRGFRLLTHCYRGHEHTPENTTYRESGRRVCRVCKRENQRRYYQQQTDAKASGGRSS